MSRIPHCYESLKHFELHVQRNNSARKYKTRRDYVRAGFPQSGEWAAVFKMNSKKEKHEFCECEMSIANQ